MTSGNTIRDKLFMKCLLITWPRWGRIRNRRSYETKGDAVAHGVGGPTHGLRVARGHLYAGPERDGGCRGGDAYCRAARTDTYRDAHGDAITDADSGANTYGGAHCDAHGNPDCHGHGHPYSHAN